MPSKHCTDLIGVPFARRREFPCGAFLAEAGCAATTVYLLSSGQVRCFSLSEDGCEATTAVLGPGQLVSVAALFGDRVNRLFVQALTPVSAWALPTAQMKEEIRRNPMLLGLVVGALAQRFALAEGLLRDVLLLPVGDRLGDMERRLSATLGGRPPALNRRQLAGLVQARPETLTRVVATPAAINPRAAQALPKLRGFRRGAVLAGLDAGPGQINQLVEGELQIALVGADKRQLSVRTLRAGEFFGIAGLVGLPPTGLTAIALTDGMVRTYSADEFLRYVASESDGLRRLAQQLGHRLTHMERQLGFAAARTARQRLIVFLRHQENQTDGTLSHELLARRIGTSRETVTRTLRVLEQEGIISRDGRRVRLRTRSADEVSRIGDVFLLAKKRRQQPEYRRHVHKSARDPHDQARQLLVVDC
jgi:CRP-like cAMP-binding protein